jgi:hypothetical protein
MGADGLDQTGRMKKILTRSRLRTSDTISPSEMEYSDDKRMAGIAIQPFFLFCWNSQDPELQKIYQVDVTE